MKKIIFIGDSLTAGFIELNQYPNIINMGVNGDRTLEVIERLIQVKEKEPDKVFLLIGTNDILTNNQIWFKDLPISIKTTYEFIVRYLANNLQAEIYLLSLLPIASVGGFIHNDDVKKVNQEIEQFNEYIKLVARKYKATYLAINKDFFVNNQLNLNYTSDGLHLNQAGYEVFLNKIKKFL